MPGGEGGELAAAATISQTSLPSQSGPIVLMAALVWLVPAHDAMQDAADAEVEPSSTKKPIHRMVIRMNQKGIIASPPSVLSRRDRASSPGRHGQLGREFLAGVAQHQQN